MSETSNNHDRKEYLFIWSSVILKQHKVLKTNSQCVGRDVEFRSGPSYMVTLRDVSVRTVKRTDRVLHWSRQVLLHETTVKASAALLTYYHPVSFSFG